MIFGLEDWEFWIAILKNGGEVKCLDQVGFFYRIKSVSMVNNIKSDRRQEIFEYISIKHADFIVGKLGSTIILNHAIQKQSKKFQNQLKSKKFVIDLFCETFFGLNIFGRYKAK